MLRLWGAALSNLQAEEGIVWTTLSLAVQRDLGSDGYGSTGLSNLLIGTAEADASVVFTEREDGLVEVGLRAVPGLNVARTALSLGGGGHAMAAGCLVAGPLDEAQRRVLEVLRADLARQRAESGDGRHSQSS